MRTVSTLCASGTALSLSAVGLTLARLDDPRTSMQERTQAVSDDLIDSRQRKRAMTAVTSYPTPDTGYAHDPSFSVRRPQAHHTRSAPMIQAAQVQNKLVGKRRDRGDVPRKDSRDSHTPIDSLLEPGQDGVLPYPYDNAMLGLSGQPSSRPISWLRRLSSSMSNSRDSSGTPTSQPSTRPSSAVFQPSPVPFDVRTHNWVDGNSGRSATPPARNRLVKRTASLRGVDSSPFAMSSPESRLPLPVLKRPATSHQRSVAFQERRLQSRSAGPTIDVDGSSLTRPNQLRAYFTPRVPVVRPTSVKSSPSSIPNPIKRVYPDRKYTPMLVSATHSIGPSKVEEDQDVDVLDMDDFEDAVTQAVHPSAASSPVPLPAAQLDSSPPPRRSFSITDLLSAGPQQLWKSHSSRRASATSKLARRIRPRVTSLTSNNVHGSHEDAPTSDVERPAKRRDLTDPLVYQRSIYTSSSSATAETQPTHDSAFPSQAASLSSRYPFSASPNHASLSKERCVTPIERTLPADSTQSLNSQSIRVSASHSEVPSTIGSDSEPLSLSDYSATDYQCDNFYDPIPVRTTRGSIGKRGPPIDTIFDESPPAFSSGRSTRLRDFLSDGQHFNSEASALFRHSTIEEEGSVLSTPVRSIRDKSVTSTPSARPRLGALIASSPPIMHIMSDADEMDWDFPTEVSDADHGLGIHQGAHEAGNDGAGSLPPPLRPVHFRLGTNSPSYNSTPNRGNNGVLDRPSLFDWSEQQPSPSRGNQSPPRPKTVHGKKDPETRGSRATGRRAPSGMHVRSHSVPVVPDVDGKRSTAVANKFGTWGVGSKGVTEDWNEDFDFEDIVPGSSDAAKLEEKRIDSGHEMFVPKSIREQQENVVANISLLREWGLLIEELKDLRIRAVALGMLHGPYAQDWKEVDAMIELADQETEEQTLEPRFSPPSSPGFDYSAFDEPNLRHMPNGRRRRSSAFADESPDSVPQGLATGASLDGPTQGSAGSPSRRPRKDSEAIARTVIESLQAQRSDDDESAPQRDGSSKKVPFDTAILRHIVPYVNGLKRRVKDALRETEGLYTSPRRRTPPEDEDFNDEEPGTPPTQPRFTRPFVRSNTAIHSPHARTPGPEDGDVFATGESRALAESMEALKLP